MSVYSNYTQPNLYIQNSSPQFYGNHPVTQIVSKPIEKVENLVKKTVDTFEPEKDKTEEEKKSRKQTIKVISTVGVVGAIVAIMNPKTLSKLGEYAQTMAKKAEAKSQMNDSFIGKVYNVGQRFFEKGANVINVMNNGNSVKDEFFKWMCTCKKEFSSVKNNTLRNILKKIDSAFVAVMKKPHEYITKIFDKISRKTIYRKYNSVNTQINLMEDALKKYKDRLTPAERIQLEAKIAEIKAIRSHFSELSITGRLNKQEELMSHLEQDAITRMKEFGHTIFSKDKSVSEYMRSRYKYIGNNMDFWAQSIVMPERNLVDKEGKEIIEKLMGNGDNIKGYYDEITEILNPHLNTMEKKLFKNSVDRLDSLLRDAQKSECIDYFDKKRDLILGSAPTDILTALGALGLSGMAIERADTKEDKRSRFITLTLPAIAGAGVSIGMASLLYTGGVSIGVGLLSSLGLNKLAAAVDKKFITKNSNQNTQNNEIVQDNPELGVQVA